MLAILSGRRPRRLYHSAAYPVASTASPDHPRSLALPRASLDPQPPLGSLDKEAISQPTPSRQRRNRYRSRNCRSFRQYGPYFQTATNPEPDRQETRLRSRLDESHERVQRLLEQHDLVESRRINARVYAVSHATDTVRRFYEFFAHGFDPVNRPVQSRQAEAFLRAVMCSNAVCSEFTGVDMFLAQYRMGTESHGAMTLSLNRLELLDNGDDAIQIQAEATTRFRITRVTLERLFPSLVQDEQLMQRLIGKEYELQYDKIFHITAGQIYQHETRVDLCTGLLQLVGDPFLALKLMEASVMTKRGHWRIEEVAEDRHEVENALL